MTLFGFSLVAAAILIVFLMDQLFLERYYESQKRDALYSAYERLDDAAKRDKITSDEFDAELVKIMSTENVEVVVLDEGSQILKYYAVNAQEMMLRMWDNLLDGSGIPSGNRKSGEPGQQEEQKNIYEVVRQLDSLDGQSFQIVRNTANSSQYIEMWGSLSGGGFYLMRTTMESIRQNSRIAGRFILYVGAAVMLLGAIASMIMGRELSGPIRQLTLISKRMRDLDFSAKYEGQDRNEIHELGENMNDLSSTLEKTISDLKTANAELRQDIDRRDQNERMQREFISNVTHELKTPIALIQGYAEALQDGIADDPEQMRDYTSVIMDESAKMNTMVQKLLTLNHLEFGQSEVSMSRFDILAMIQGCTASSQILMDEAGIRMRISPPAGELYVWSDQFMAEEVFQNYLSNAIHHCEVSDDTGSKNLDIRCEEVSGDSGKKVRISVFNSGTPIPEESLARIWEKFYKVDKARTREYGGSGVGLSIVKAIMEQLGEQYGVKNYDNGVCFWFELDAG